MQKLWRWCSDKLLSIATLFLLAFIPLYPKLPLLDVKHTWVYVRLEDFLVLSVLFLWGWQLVRRKVTLTTPLTLSMLLFWFIGGVATLHGVLLVFPTLSDAFPTVSFLSFLRRIEYMSLFFVAFAAVKDKGFLSRATVVITATVLLVALYGIGQKYLGFPAFLTMNEEFAKGIALRLSPLSRVSSTFAGHYDLAAYLVLVLPILVSVVFAIQHWARRGVVLFAVFLGLVALFMTVSRISLVAFLVSLGVVFFLIKKRLVLLFVSALAMAGLLLVVGTPQVFERLGSTIKEIDVLVDAKSGGAIGHVTDVPNTYFEGKVVKQQFSKSITDLDPQATTVSTIIYPHTSLPPRVVLLVEPNAPTGENLPQGTGYINLSLSPVVAKLGSFFYEPQPKSSTTSAEVLIINGSFLRKRVFAYDLSFTTRFQGEWPRAISAFKRNVLLGSGYGSVGLAVDNSYLRLLGEVGAAGASAFVALFLLLGLYLRRVISGVGVPLVKHFVIGFVAGMVGLAVNALFIDVFEASKIAFVLWLLAGIVLGTLHLFQKRPFEASKELLRVVASPVAIGVFIFTLTILWYGPMLRNNFVGDDFTWFRWAADCGGAPCQLDRQTIWRYFTDAGGFFWRPGTKIYFLLMYSWFWLNQTAYHLVSLLLHGWVAILVLLLARKILRHLSLSVGAAFLFIILSGYAEQVYWIAATGHLFAAGFILSSLLGYIVWEETKKPAALVAALGFFLLSLLFHEAALVTPLFCFLYRVLFCGRIRPRDLWVDPAVRLFLLPIPLYLVVRLLAGSHWWSGDYSYNLLRLPFNALGNAIGYFFLIVIGPLWLTAYHAMRTALREQPVVAGVLLLGGGGLVGFLFSKFFAWVAQEDRKTLWFAVGFFLIALLPFLGLGNIASRYSYLPAIGVAILLVIGVKNLSSFLLPNGRGITLAAIAVGVSVFSLFQVIQQQKLQSDWYEAGEVTRRFTIAMQETYEDEWGRERLELHFVNVPIRRGEAWVFPVGIPDALWLLFRNPRLSVYLWPSVEMAFARVEYDSTNQKVFEFDGSGAVMERKKIRPTQ